MMAHFSFFAISISKIYTKHWAYTWAINKIPDWLLLKQWSHLIISNNIKSRDGYSRFVQQLKVFIENCLIFSGWILKVLVGFFSLSLVFHGFKMALEIEAY